MSTLQHENPPRRSKRMQGIWLSSTVGLKKHRKSRKTTAEKAAIGQHQHEDITIVLGSDLDVEEEETEQAADEEV